MIRSMLEPLNQTAARVPDRVAFYDDREQMTYAQLRRAARSIGTALTALARPGQAVALLLDPRSIQNIPALYGALFAGCAYAPMDISMPPERLRQLLGLLEPAAVIVDEKGGKALDAAGGRGAPVLSYREALGTADDEEKLAAIEKTIGPDAPMSILYTSGSTGVPKGSVQTHGSYIQWTDATIRMYGLGEDTVFGNQSPFFYANSILDIFPPVALGARVYLLPAGVLTFPRRLIQCLNAHHITEFCMTPSSFIGVVNAGVLTKNCLPELRWGIMSGESMPWEPLKAWMDASPNASWWHFYGSTEMFSVAVGRVTPDYGLEARLPVGRLFPQVEVLFLEDEKALAPAGEPGEMYVLSPWVASGYYRDPERTAQAWEEIGGKTYYRSGDMGYIRPDGQLMVLGRKDSQIKHMGYRMELGDVENALRAVQGVGESCVLYDRERDRIYCFYAGAMEEKELRRALRDRLARYMLPDALVRLPAMPHTASMKIDRAALKKLMSEPAGFAPCEG